MESSGSINAAAELRDIRRSIAGSSALLGWLIALKARYFCIERLTSVRSIARQMKPTMTVRANGNCIFDDVRTSFT